MKGRVSKSPSTAAPNNEMAATRKRLATTITTRRLRRSTSAPLTRANSSQGSWEATTVPVTSTGSRVNVVANRGRAAKRTRLQTLEIVLAAHSFQ